jgi:hypothetical protein
MRLAEKLDCKGLMMAPKKLPSETQDIFENLHQIRLISGKTS